MFDLLLHNKASKKIILYSGLENTSDDQLYILFENFELTQGEPDGEYDYFLIYNGRDDVEYEFGEVPLNTILHTADGDVKLKDLYPIVGLLKVGNPEDNTTYKKNKEKTEYIYR